MSTLLAIFAHPDDESFGPGGTLAKCSREGYDVHVCIVTDGAAGTHDPIYLASSGHDNLAELRREEVECACKVLGAKVHMLGYGDSGMRGDPRNWHPSSLNQVDLDEVAADILALMKQVSPNIILTHDPTGSYHHPDHIKVNQAVRHAFKRGRLYDSGISLYYNVIPRSAVTWYVRLMRLLRIDPTRAGENKDIDFTRVGVPDTDIDIKLDVSSYLEIKERASACHASQGGGAIPRYIPRFLVRRWQRYEYFVQVFPQERHG